MNMNNKVSGNNHWKLLFMFIPKHSACFNSYMTKSNSEILSTVNVVVIDMHDESTYIDYQIFDNTE